MFWPKLLPLKEVFKEVFKKIMNPTLIHLGNGNVIPFSLTNFLKRFENPGPKIRGFFLTILEDLKTYFFQFF